MFGAELRCKTCNQYTPDRCTCQKPTHWMDDRGLVVTDDWLQNDPRSTSDYRAAYNIPCVKRYGRIVPIGQRPS